MASGNVNMDFYRRFFLERQHKLEEDSQLLIVGYPVLKKSGLVNEFKLTASHTATFDFKR
jgi:ribosome-interacting GTPase 1